MRQVCHVRIAPDVRAAADQFDIAVAREVRTREAGPAKRGMDPLEVSVEEGRVKVRFERFRLDVAGREKA